MNKIKHHVLEVLGEPERKEWEWEDEGGECWTLEVKYDSYGREGTTKLVFDSKESAEEIEPGHIFHA